MVAVHPERRRADRPVVATRGPIDPARAVAGLDQLGRYLGRSWRRAGIAADRCEDCTQAVYLALLEAGGRARFEGLLERVAARGVRAALGREAAGGPEFLRIVDRIKKRALREHRPGPLGPGGDPASRGDAAAERADRLTLEEAIGRTLSPSEAALVAATLAGETPAEIAARWGLAPKTVSNAKTRALARLRGALGGVGA